LNNPKYENFFFVDLKKFQGKSLIRAGSDRSRVSLKTECTTSPGGILFF